MRHYKFRFANAGKLALTVTATSNICVQTGKNPAFEKRMTTLFPDENGIYTLTNLQGDTDIKVTGSVAIEEGSVVTPEEVMIVSNDDARNITSLGVSGTVDESTFEGLRDKFESLETLNMAEIENDTIPAGAFNGMENLKTVVIPEHVTAIGDNAFAGCTSLESITLPGVESIGQNAFDGCSSLTSITLMAHGSQAAARAPRRAPAAGLNAAAFKGLNPNCLIYVSEEFDGFAADSLNIIVSRNEVRQATSSIVLDGRYPFNVPEGFSLAGYSISYTVDVPGALAGDNNGWKGIVLPFTPRSVQYDFSNENRGERTLKYVTLEDGAEALTPGVAVEANRPFLANLFAPVESLPVTFSTTGLSNLDTLCIDVDYTPAPEEIVVRGSKFALHGSFGTVNEGGELYVLNAEGSAFCRADADSVAVSPFTVYATATDGATPDLITLATHPLWVLNPESDKASGSRLYRSETIELTTATADAEILYTTDGSDPAENGIVYTEPFGVAGEDVVITAMARAKGYDSDKVTMNFGLRKTNIDYALDEGWNWISHNVENTVELAEVISDNIDRVLSRDEEVIRDPIYGLVGTLGFLEPLKAYKVHTTTAGAAKNFGGISADPSDYISLVKGWNWIGYPVEDADLAVADALANFDAEEGDMIVSREGFAQADAEGNWIGDLATLSVGQGYMFLSNSPKLVQFNTVPTSADSVSRVVRYVETAPWTAMKHLYPSVMPVTSRIVKNGGLAADEGEYIVGAFCGDECRGIGVAVNGYVMLSVFGNEGDLISFRLLSNVDHSESQLEQTLRFAENPVGNLVEPYIFDAIHVLSVNAVHSDSYNVVVENGSIIVEGNSAAVGRVEVFNVAGMMIARAESSVKVDNLAPGIYVVAVYTGGQRNAHKIEVK